MIRRKFIITTMLPVMAWLFFENFNISKNEQHQLSPPNAQILSRKSTQSAVKTANIDKEESYRIKKIVLDAGHGGKDPGCSGIHSKEKHNTLDIVLKLGAKISQNFPDVEVIYTRETDVFVDLFKRADIANKENADLFISVHCNSVSAPAIHGTETYVMGLHTAQSNLEVAKRENSSIYLEDDYKKNYEGYDPNSPEAHIFGSVWQSAYLEQSILLASFVQHKANEIAERSDKGVKQAGFIVLKATAMPAVLVETGYLTNGNEDRFLASDDGRDLMATSIFEAFKSYKNQMETGETGHIEVNKPKKSNPEVHKPIENPTPKPKKKIKEPTQEEVVLFENNTQKVEPKITVSEPIVIINEPVVIEPSTYKILLTSSKSKIDLNSERFNLVPSNIEEVKQGSQYRYFIGTFASENDALMELSELRKLGFSKAAVIKSK
jgi:N-acetylmuramoyl-L-alanine amidase